MTLTRAVGNIARWSMPLLCVAIAILWYGSNERVLVLNGPIQTQASVAGGSVTLLIDADAHFPEYRPRSGFHTFYSTRRWWFQGGWSRTVKWISIPLWVPFAACSAAGFAAWRHKWRLRHRLRRRLCPSCGYSLAGLDHQAPCPECGQSAPSAAPSDPAHSASDG